MMERGQADWSRALLLASVCVKLAAIPLFFWLLRLADELPAVVLGLIVAVVDMAAFGEFWVSAQAAPNLITPPGLLLGAAAATSFFAALLMLTQRSLKRLLVLSTVEDVGFLLLGLASASALGINGAMIAASTHALAKALLFVCLSGPEADGALEGEQTGLVARYPVSTFGFLFGMLAMLGIPPTMGFIGRWRLYETALRINPLLLTVFILSSAFALIAYTLALTRVWWGPAPGADPPSSSPPQPLAHPTSEPFALQAAIVALTGLLLVAGLWPGMIGMLMGGRP
jgi:formate hydrogenlyase subunit 3/multisubunit Na+/H+ antiporter MnhD subunit